MRIGIDCDGVLYPFTEVFRLYAEQETGERFGPVERWEFYKDWGMGTPEFLQLMEEACKGGFLFRYGTPPANCVNVMNWLACWPEHEVVIITHRGEYARHATEGWLRDWMIPYDELIIDSDKTRHGLDLLLDDGPHIIEKFREAGGRGVVFHRRWNRHIGGERVRSWLQFKSLIEEGPKWRATLPTKCA